MIAPGTGEQTRGRVPRNLNRLRRLAKFETCGVELAYGLGNIHKRMPEINSAVRRLNLKSRRSPKAAARLMIYPRSCAPTISAPHHDTPKPVSGALLHSEVGLRLWKTL